VRTRQNGDQYSLDVCCMSHSEGSKEAAYFKQKSFSNSRADAPRRRSQFNLGYLKKEIPEQSIRSKIAGRIQNHLSVYSDKFFFFLEEWDYLLFDGDCRTIKVFWVFGFHFIYHTISCGSRCSLFQRFNL
jgi:hypothetical protein